MQISWKNVFLLAALLFALPLTGTPAQAAGLFGGTSAGDSVFVGEVQSYGDYELKADACATFVDKLAEALRQQGIAVSGRADLMNEEGRHDAIGSGDEAAKLAHYADMAMGRAYFHQEERLAAWRKSKASYRLSPDKQRTAAVIAAKYGAKYLLFVNLKDFDVRLKHSIFATHTERETKGKKLSASLDYYLVNARTGRVYEKHIENKKTAQMVNFGLGKTGKGMDVDTLLGEVMETSAKDIAADVKKHGLDEVKSNGTALAH